MIRKAASLLAIVTLALGSAAFAEVHGGAIPKNLSFYDSAEFVDVQWATGRDAAPVWGSLVLEGADGIRFVPDNGVEVKFPYTDIQAIKYERTVKAKEKRADQKWFQRPLAFARGVETYRTITLEHGSGESRAFSKMRIDELNATGIIRLLEIKTGLRVKKMSNL